MSDGICGMGTTLEIAFTPGAAGSDFDPVAEILNPSGWGGGQDSIDFTHAGSQYGAREYKPGPKEGGEITFEVNFIPNNVSHIFGDLDTFALLEDFDTATAAVKSENRNFRISFPPVVTGNTGAKCTFLGHITNVEGQAPHDDKVSATVTVKVSGLPTWTAEA